jgi:hypothetical protein
MTIIFIIITLITFGIFFIEAIVHYNEGRREITKQTKKTLSECLTEEIIQNDFDFDNRFIMLPNNIKIHIPKNQELIKLILTIIFFSTINGLVSTLFISLHLK